MLGEKQRRIEELLELHEKGFISDEELREGRAAIELGQDKFANDAPLASRVNIRKRTVMLTPELLEDIRAAESRNEDASSDCRLPETACPDEEKLSLARLGINLLIFVLISAAVIFGYFRVR